MTTKRKQLAAWRRATARYREKMSSTYPEWYVWRSMKERCARSTHPMFDYYGGKGISVCERWIEKGKGFWNFLEDMGRRPDGHELDRIDSNKDYCPENCRWLSQFENRSRANGKEQYLPPETPISEDELEPL